HIAQRPCARQVVQQQAIDVQQHEAIAEVGGDVTVPDLVEQGLAHGFLRGRYQHPSTQEGRRFAQGWSPILLYRSEKISLSCIVRLHDPACSGVLVERQERCGRTVTRPVMATPDSVSKSRWIAGAAVVGLVIAAGAGWLFFGNAAKPLP